MGNSRKLSDEKIQRMLRWYIDDVAISKICDRIGISRQTFYNYSNDGILTDGQPWDEYKEHVQNERELRRQNEALEVKVESTTDMVEDVLPDLKQAVARISKDLRDGRVATDAGDLDTITRVIRRLENQGAELHEKMERFKKKVAMALYEVLSERKADLVVQKIEEQEKRMMTEYDADYAELMLSE